MGAVNMLSLIEKKKFGQALSDDEIRSWVGSVVDESAPIYQSAALLMAIRLKGMNFDETLALTQAMTDSGDRFSFPDYTTIFDKHSTGGIGDKVTLLLGPMVAACGAPVTMLSGRGLGFSGGTIDKFESIPGVSCQRSETEMREMVKDAGWANAQASESIAPADRILYGLRDVTGTVDSIPLITASILSKKIAGGATHLCLDVKCGSGAFMPNLEAARELADNLKKIGEMGGLSIQGVISRMDEPLGNAVGNYLEVLESVALLRGEDEGPLMDLVYELSSIMLEQASLANSRDEAMTKLRESVRSGAALDRLLAYLRFNGAKEEAVSAMLAADVEKLPRVAVHAPRAGVISGINGRGVGELMVRLGAGRQKHTDTIDPGAGLYLAKHVGDAVNQGDVLGWFYGERRDQDFATDALLEQITIGDEPVEKKGIILDRV